MPPDEINEEWQRQCENEERMIEEEARGSGMTELKPCPFCGSERTVEKLDGMVFYIRCQDCGAKGPAKTLKPKAIEAWNRRGEK